jgi:hypothetical protein
VGMPAKTLRVYVDAERRSLRYHAERGNDQTHRSPSLRKVPHIVIVPTLRVGMPAKTLRVYVDAER